MGKIVRSRLREILDNRGLSIRQLADTAGLKFETVRKLRNDDAVQYHRESLGAVCEALEVGIADVLVLEHSELSDAQVIEAYLRMHNVDGKIAEVFRRSQFTTEEIDAMREAVKSDGGVDEPCGSY